MEITEAADGADIGLVPRPLMQGRQDGLSPFRAWVKPTA